MSTITSQTAGVVEDPLPKPLQSFSGLAEAVTPALRNLETIHARYLEHKNAGRILANSVEAHRVELTYHSNAIEGSTLSLRETQLIIEGFAPTSGKTLREIYEARNHDRALRDLEERVKKRPLTSALTEQDILDVHAHVLADIVPRSLGRFRTDRVLIKGSHFIPPRHKFGVLIPKMLDLANQKGVHPVLQAGELHYNLVAIHPFADGNDRTARLLLNYHLLRHGYPHTIIEVEKRAEYLEALEEANSGHCERFAIFVAQCAERSIQKLIGED